MENWKTNMYSQNNFCQYIIFVHIKFFITKFINIVKFCWFVKDLVGDSTTLCYIWDFANICACSKRALLYWQNLLRVFMAYDCLMHPSYSALTKSPRNAYWSDKRSSAGVLLLWILHCHIWYSNIRVLFSLFWSQL